MKRNEINNDRRAVNGNSGHFIGSSIYKLAIDNSLSQKQKTQRNYWPLSQDRVVEFEEECLPYTSNNCIEYTYHKIVAGQEDVKIGDKVLFYAINDNDFEYIEGVVEQKNGKDALAVSKDKKVISLLFFEDDNPLHRFKQSWISLGVKDGCVYDKEKWKETEMERQIDSYVII